MPDVRIGLDWWPPPPDEELGDDRARELVQRLQEIAPPVVAAAEADLRKRSAPGTELVRGSAPLSYFARVRFGDEMRSLCIGTVYQKSAGDPDSNSIQLGRDGVLRWHRD